MEEKKGYNGWTNYETWLVKLWIDNKVGSYNFWREEAKERLEDDKETAIWKLEDELKESFDETNPIREASVWSDLMGAALGEVDWYEIAESFIQDVKDNER